MTVQPSAKNAALGLKFGARAGSRTREWIGVLLVSAALVALLQLPYLLGYIAARPGMAYTGLIMNPEDSNSYLAKMQEGRAGEWLYTIPYTAEPQRAEFVGGFYLLLGQLARLLGLSVIQMWHGSRIVLGILLCVLTYIFIKQYLDDGRARRLAFALALVGGGLGWLVFLTGQTYWLGFFPVDFKMPEAHLFFTLLTFPHFIAGTSLLLTSFGLIRRVFETGSPLAAGGAGLANLSLAVVYPFLIYLVVLVYLFSWLAFSWDILQARRSAGATKGGLAFLLRSVAWRKGWAAGVALLIPAPLLLFYFWVLRTNPVFAGWEAQSVTPSPHPLQYLAAFGPMLAFAAPTWRDRKLRGLWLWVLAAALLVYAPLNPQRRFVEGVQVPFAILAASGIWDYYLPRIRSTRLFQRLAQRPHYTAGGLQRLALISLLMTLALSNLYLLASTSVTAAVDQPYPFFRSLAEIQAVDWAGANLPRDSVLLASSETGNFIPTRANLRTVVGHWAETVDFEKKQDAVDRFFDSAGGRERQAAWLQEQRVDYIFYGPREQVRGKSALAGLLDLVTVYENDQVAILKVNR